MSQIFQNIVDKTRDLVEPLVVHAGMELIDVEFLREGGRWVLRLTIDKPEGVGLDECQEISRQAEASLDVEDFIEQAYALEVSSPGIERPLKTKEHFERFVGSEVQVKTFGPIGEPPRKNFKGRLLGMKDETVRLEIDGAEYGVPLDKIAKANLVFDFDAGKGVKA